MRGLLSAIRHWHAERRGNPKPPSVLHRVSLDIGAAELLGAVSDSGADILYAGAREAILADGSAGSDTLTGGSDGDWLAGGTRSHQRPRREAIARRGAPLLAAWTRGNIQRRRLVA